MAERSRQNGKTPVMAVLTDGKANIDLDGNPGRDKAIDDAQKITSIARTLKFPQFSSMLVDNQIQNFSIWHIKWMQSI